MINDLVNHFSPNAHLDLSDYFPDDFYRTLEKFNELLKKIPQKNSTNSSEIIDKAITKVTQALDVASPMMEDMSIAKDTREDAWTAINSATKYAEVYKSAIANGNNSKADEAAVLVIANLSSAINKINYAAASVIDDKNGVAFERPDYSKFYADEWDNQITTIKNTYSLLNVQGTTDAGIAQPSSVEEAANSVNTINFDQRKQGNINMDKTFKAFFREFVEKYKANFKHYTTDERKKFFEIEKSLNQEIKKVAEKTFNLLNRFENASLANISDAKKNKEKLEGVVDSLNKQIETNYPARLDDFAQVYLRDYLNNTLIPKLESLTKENQDNPIILTLHSPGYSKDNLTLIKDGDNLQFKEETHDSTLTIEHFFSKNQSVNLRLETDSTQMYKLDQKVKDYLVKNEASHSTDIVIGPERGIPMEVSFSTLFPGDGDSYTYLASQTRHYADFRQKQRITLSDTGLLKHVYHTGGNNIRTTVEGTTGDDVYHYNLSDGPLFIIDHSGGPQGKKGGGTDTLILNSGITVDDIRLVRSGEDFNWGRNTETSADLKLEILSRDKKTVIGGITLSMHFDKTSSTEIEKLVVGNQTFNLDSLGDSLLPLQENNHQVSLREAIRDGAVTEEKKISQSVIQSGGLDFSLAQDDLKNTISSLYLSETMGKFFSGELTPLGKKYGFEVREEKNMYNWTEDTMWLSANGRIAFQPEKQLVKRAQYETFITALAGINNSGAEEEGYHSLAETRRWLREDSDSQGQKLNNLDLANNLVVNHNLKMVKTNSIIDGGNMLTGRRVNGRPYVLIGRDAVLQTTLAHYSDKGQTSSPYYAETFIDQKLNSWKPDDKTVDRMVVMLKKGGFIESATYNEAKKEAVRFLAMNEISQDIMAAELNVSREDLVIITQPDFHIDMHLRLLADGRVLMNDYHASQELIQNLLDDQDNRLTSENKTDLEKALLEMKQKHQTMQPVNELIEKQLQSKGLEVIKTPGVFQAGKHQVNYMNGIMGTSPAGEMFYITNASSIEPLNHAFSKWIQKQQFGLNVEFVGKVQPPHSNSANNIAEYLLDRRGGFDCITLHHGNPAINSLAQQMAAFPGQPDSVNASPASVLAANRIVEQLSTSTYSTSQNSNQLVA